ncbi:E3 ubiquitin-protein ligase TRIM16 [Danio aesculapii]|uniref:E3 ubiquitin-protein ligase TRIM16 n=1 Tax=Danio aesculapii TaxID=1142201 RepID=UPI0024C0102C|nr:E3 ubiquitin-protein ligase TRIM16 [Danio aesculapii]
MAESSVSLAQDQFNCSICLDLLKDPVAIPCGHSYCMSCISGYWDQDEQRGVYSCPQCRQTFIPRPALGKNTMLTEVVEKLRKRKLQAARPAQCNSESGDVECDVCTGDKNKAIKSCLMCLNSYCQNHLEQHETFFKIKRHDLMDATGRLQEMICSQHEKLLGIFCRTDKRCICYLCTMDEHKNHDTVSAAAERTDKQKHFEETLQKRIQENQKEREELRAALETHKRSAQAAVEDTERIFTELICSIERSRSEVTQLIRDQEKAAVSGAEGRLKKLEQEIDDLKRRNTELEQISNTDNHIHFLQNSQSFSVPPESTDTSIQSRLSFDDLVTFVSQVKEKLQQTVKKEQENIFRIVRYINVMPSPQNKSRNDFLQYFKRFTLASNTAHESLKLSEGNRVATRTKKALFSFPDIFDNFAQVLCNESVSGCCYWEVEQNGRGMCASVAYKSISRKGQGYDCRFGHNDQSWGLYFSDFSCSFWHNNIQTKLPAVSSSSRIGVYVDLSTGTLSFYSVSGRMSLIHRVYTTFTEPLCPGFGVYHDSQLKLCD